MSAPVFLFCDTCAMPHSGAAVGSQCTYHLCPGVVLHVSQIVAAHHADLQHARQCSILLMRFAKHIIAHDCRDNIACSRCEPGGADVVEGYVCTWHMAEELAKPKAEAER